MCSLFEDNRTSATRPHLLKFAKYVRIPPALAYFVGHYFQSFASRTGAFVRPLRGERVVDIHDLQHSRHYRNLFAPEAIGITRTVSSFVVMADNGEYLTE